LAPLLIPLSVVGSGKLSPSEYWISSVDKESFEASQDIAADSLGNIFYLGFTSGSVGSMVLIKYDSFGLIIWLKEYRCNGLEGYGISLKVDSSNNLYIVGTGKTVSTSRLDFAMLKLDNDGNILWQKTLYDGTNSYSPFHSDIGDVDAAGSFYGMTITSLNPAVNVNITDCKIVKLNNSGTLQTQRHFYYSSAREVAFRSMRVNRSTGEVYASGDHNEDNFLTSVPAIVKTNSALSSISWSREHPLSAGSGSITSTSIDSSGNSYSVMFFTDPALTSVLVKFNSSGTVQWQRQTNTSIGVFWLYVYAAPDGFIYLYGRDQMVAGRMVIFKYNSSGVLQWQRYLDNAGYVYVTRLSMDSSGALVLTIDRDNTGAYNMMTVRIPADGSLIGTHGAYVYGAGSYTESSYSGSWIASNISLQNPATYSTTLSITDANYSEAPVAPYTQTRTDIR
jgi:hypothetical protein